MNQRVTVFMNTDRDNFDGYKPGHQLATAEDLTFTVEGKADNVLVAAEEMFTIGNRMGFDLHNRAWPSDVRSVSVGDVIRVHANAEVDGAYLAVAPVGLKWVESPKVNQLVPLAGQERVTSR